jgi:hypothetical protein
MITYVGQTRGRKTIAALEELGFGECVQRGEGAARRHPWFLDNGAFRDFKAGTEFDTDAYIASFARHADSPAPDFIVLPDIVEGGSESLAFSISWYQRVRELSLETWGTVPPVYIAVQDGMNARDIDTAIAFADGIFIGGSTNWKIAAAPGIIQRAHGELPQIDDDGTLELAGRKPVHIGRVGSGRRIVWARLIGADSIDSCLPLMTAKKREIAAGAALELVRDALARFAPAGKLASDSVAGLVRRSFLFGHLDERSLELMSSVAELVTDTQQQRRAKR